MRPLLFLALASSLVAADWSTYRADASRSGYTSETIPNQLRQRWAFRLPSGQRIAWPNSEGLTIVIFSVRPLFCEIRRHR